MEEKKLRSFLCHYSSFFFSQITILGVYEFRLRRTIQSVNFFSEEIHTNCVEERIYG